jgi:hypothetical protein
MFLPGALKKKKKKNKNYTGSATVFLESSDTLLPISSGIAAVNPICSDEKETRSSTDNAPGEYASNFVLENKVVFDDQEKLYNEETELEWDRSTMVWCTFSVLFSVVYIWKKRL